MIYSEAAHFDSAHVAHCAAREEFQRLRRIETRARAARRRPQVRS